MTNAQIQIGGSMVTLLLLLSATLPAQDSTVYTAVAAGGFFTCALSREGAAYCWGFGRYGQLGNGDTASSQVPRPVRQPDSTHFTSLALGRDHACALGADSLAYCWGVNWEGQIGTDSSAETCNFPKKPERTFACSLRPRPVAGNRHFAAISAGAGHTCAITGTGDAYCWGSGPGVLGNEAAPATAMIPVAVSGGLHFRSISDGLNHTCGVTVEGTLYCWGYNNDNQLGHDDDSLKMSKKPIAILDSVKFISVTAGGQHTCALATDSTAYCWGNFEHGRLGIGESLAEKFKGKKHQIVPAPVEGGHTFRWLSAGGVHTCAVGTDGQAYCWGDDLDGRVGLNSSMLGRKPWVTKPSAIANDLRFTMISAGDYHSCGVTVAGAVYCWGGNRDGQLGTGTTKGGDKIAHIMNASAAHP